MFIKKKYIYERKNKKKLEGWKWSEKITMSQVLIELELIKKISTGFVRLNLTT